MTDEHDLYAKVEKGIDAFSQPFNELEQLLRTIPDETLRKSALRSLGEVMVHLDEIAYHYRKHLGLTKLSSDKTK